MTGEDKSTDHLNPEFTEIKRYHFRIILIASSPSVVSVLGAQLNQDGILVRSATTLEQVEEEARNLPHAYIEPPDLVMLEQPQTLELARERITRILNTPSLAGTSLVILSEDKHYAPLMRSIALGAVDYILLPVAQRSLVMHLNRLFGLDMFGPMYAGGRFVRNFHRFIEKEIKRSTRTKAPFSIMLGHLQFGQDIPLGCAE